MTPTPTQTTREMGQINAAAAPVIFPANYRSLSIFFFSSRRRHTRFDCDWSSDVCSSDLRTYKQTGIRLESAATFVVSATLEVGEMSATVEVTAAKLQADTTTNQLGGELAAAELKDFPLFKRAWINLQTTLPGVVASNDRFTNNFSTNGSRTQSNNYTVNGTDSNDLPLNTPIANAINPDAIQEVKVVDSTLNPEYGRNSGGTLIGTTKSG